MTEAAPPSAAAAQARILSHMNSDHHDSLVLYLEHFHHVPSSTARHARLIDLNLHSMRITTAPSPANPSTTSPSPSASETTSAHTYTIPFDPPLSSPSAYRPTLIALHKECIAGLNRSPHTISSYRAPRALHLAVAASFVGTCILFVRRDWLVPGNAQPRAYAWIAARFPWLYGLQPWVLWGMIGVHVLETLGLDRRLRRHNVPRLSGVWWAWLSSCLFEGFGSWVRTGEIVREKEEKAKKEEKAH